MVPGELTHRAPVGLAVPLSPTLACVVDRDPINILTPLTSMFLHGGWGHILGNALFFWVFGNNIEDSMGPGRFLVFYLLCGLIAAATHILVAAGSPVPTVGASGAISGVLGAYLVLYPKVRVNMLFIFVIFFRVVRDSGVDRVDLLVRRCRCSSAYMAPVGRTCRAASRCGRTSAGSSPACCSIKLFENPRLVAQRNAIREQRQLRPRQLTAGQASAAAERLCPSWRGGYLRPARDTAVSRRRALRATVHPEDPMLGRLLPRDDQFFELFDQLAAHLATTAKMLDALFGDIQHVERPRQGDQGHRAQGRSADGDDQSADRQELHHADRPRGHSPARVAPRRRDRSARRHVAPASRCCTSPTVLPPARAADERAAAARRTRSRSRSSEMRKPPLVNQHVALIKQLEEEGDAIYHEAVGALFAGNARSARRASSGRRCTTRSSARSTAAWASRRCCRASP